MLHKLISPAAVRSMLELTGDVGRAAAATTGRLTSGLGAAAGSFSEVLAPTAPPQTHATDDWTDRLQSLTGRLAEEMHAALRAARLQLDRPLEAVVSGDGNLTAPGHPQQGTVELILLSDPAVLETVAATARLLREHSLEPAVVSLSAP